MILISSKLTLNENQEFITINKCSVGEIRLFVSLLDCIVCVFKGIIVNYIACL